MLAVEKKMFLARLFFFHLAVMSVLAAFWLPSPVLALCHEPCRTNDFCRRHESGGAHCEHCWGHPPVCREYPQPPPPHPPPPSPPPPPPLTPLPPAPTHKRPLVFMYDYFGPNRSAEANSAIVPSGGRVEMIWGGDAGQPSSGRALGGNTSARLSPGDFTVAAVMALLQTGNDYVHVDEVKDEPGCLCELCAGVVEQICAIAPAKCGRFLFFFRYPPNDASRPITQQAAILRLAAEGKVRKIFFETYRGAIDPGPWLDAANIASHGAAAFSEWAATYKDYPLAVIPTVGLGNSGGPYVPMNRCADDMAYVRAMFALIQQKGAALWDGVAIYGASKVKSGVCPQYSEADVIYVVKSSLVRFQ